MDISYDFLFVGGGLASTLAGLKLKANHPNLKILILESAQEWGGNHTWCIHEHDLGVSFESHWVYPLISKIWDAHTVHFPGFTRQINRRYGTIRSESARATVKSMLGETLRLATEVEQIRSDYVTLTDGSIYSARCVIDGRGRYPNNFSCPQAYQKFLGLEIVTPQPHHLRFPILMDARVPQFDGFRFIYVLPFDEHTLLVEDTRFELSALFYNQSYEQGICEYIKSIGIGDYRITYEELGKLPLPLFGAQSPIFGAPTPAIGIAGGIFHATTGYSIGHAVEFAEWLCEHATKPNISRMIRDYSVRHWSNQSFYRRLNNMLYHAAAAHEQRNVLEKFYRLDEHIIARFYSGKLKWWDKLNILSGKPPVPVIKGVREFLRQRATLA